MWATLPDVRSCVHASCNAGFLRNGLKCGNLFMLFARSPKKYDFIRALKIYCKFTGRFLGLWAIYTIVSSFVGVTVYFLFNLATDQDIPYHRWQSVRLALFAIFAFYGFMHLLHGSREVYPVHFLKTYLFALCFVGVGVCLQEGVHDLEYLLPARFFWVAVSLHFTTGVRLRRYFSKNNRPWATPVRSVDRFVCYPVRRQDRTRPWRRDHPLV